MLQTLLFGKIFLQNTKDTLQLELLLYDTYLKTAVVYESLTFTFQKALLCFI
jgi:hypothetical protein